MAARPRRDLEGFGCRRQARGYFTWSNQRIEDSRPFPPPGGRAVAKSKAPRRSGRRGRASREKVACWLPAEVAATLRAIAAFRGCQIGEVVEPALRRYLGKQSYVVDAELGFTLLDAEGER